MKKIFVFVMLAFATMTCQAQEKVINVQMTDGTVAQTRAAELDEITFLTLEEGGQGLIVKTVGGETARVLFEANPVVTISNGKMVVKSDPSVKQEFVITDIEEILFGDATDPAGIDRVDGFAFVLQKEGALLRGIPENVKPRVYSVDGRSIPLPHYTGGELLLTRESLGTGVFIVKVGTFTTKIMIGN